MSPNEDAASPSSLSTNLTEIDRGHEQSEAVARPDRSLAVPTTGLAVVGVPTTLSDVLEFAGATLEIDPPSDDSSASAMTGCQARITVPTEAFGFARGSADIPNDAVVSALAGDVASLERTDVGRRIESITVEGFASVEGDTAANLALSEARAQAVAQAIGEHSVLSTVELVAIGRGETEEFAQGWSEDSLALNRVVQISVELTTC